MPMFINTTARISNGALAVPLASLAVFLVIDYFMSNPNGRRAAQIGIVLGLGLLSKAYFLAIVGAACALFVISLFSAADRKRRLRHIAVVIALAAGISSWWYARNYVLYGNLSGLQELTLTANLSVGERLDLARAVPWQAAWHIMFKQHIWLGNMSLMEFSRAIYNWGYGLILLSICGLLYAGFKAARRWTRSGPAKKWVLQMQDPIPGISLLFYSFFLLALAYHMWQNFILVRMPGGTGGYYLYAAIIPELLLRCA